MITENQLADILKEKVKMLNSNYNQINSFNLLNETSIKLLVAKRKTLNIRHNTLVDIILRSNDDKFKKSIVDNKYDFGLCYTDIYLIVKSLSDDELKKEIVDSNCYQFDSESLDEIIETISDDEYKISKLLSYKGLKEHEYGSGIIAASLDKKIINQLIIDRNIYEFTPKTLAIILTSANSDYYKQYLNSFYNYGYFGPVTNKKIKLDPKMSFGIEIEYLGKRANKICGDSFGLNWDAHDDRSLKNGYELASPPYKNDGSVEKEIDKVCKVLSIMDYKVDESCAGQIHIGASYFDEDPECLKTFVEIYDQIERPFYYMMNKEGEVPRAAIFVHAKPIARSLNFHMSDLNNENKQLNTLSDFANCFWSIRAVKGFGLNLRYFSSEKFYHAQRTIEFRQPNGTLDSDVWIDNINFIGSFMERAKEITEIKRKDKKTKEEIIKIAQYEMLFDDTLSEKEKVVIFVNLVAFPEDRHIYLKRYNVNKDLELDPDLVPYLGVNEYKVPSNKTKKLSK